VQKWLEKTLNLRQIRAFSKSAIMQRLWPLQHPHFGSKIKIPRIISKSTVQKIQNCSVQKTARKNTKNSRDGTNLKITHNTES